MTILTHESLGVPATLAGQRDRMGRISRNVKGLAGVTLWAIESKELCICMCVLYLVRYLDSETSHSLHLAFSPLQDISFRT